MRLRSRSHYTSSRMPLLVSCLRLVRRFVVLGLLLLATASSAQTPPFAVGGDPRIDPGDFAITVFASDLAAPLPMQELSDGSLLVGTNDGLLRLLDADDDGVADDRARQRTQQGRRGDCPRINRISLGHAGSRRTDSSIVT